MQATYEIWFHLNDCRQHDDCRQMVAKATSEKFPTRQMAETYIRQAFRGVPNIERFYAQQVS